MDQVVLEKCCSPDHDRNHLRCNERKHCRNEVQCYAYHTGLDKVRGPPTVKEQHLRKTQTIEDQHERHDAHTKDGVSAHFIEQGVNICNCRSHG